MTFSKKGMAKKEKVLKTVFTQRLTTKKRDDKIRTANETISTEQIAQDGPKQTSRNLHQGKEHPRNQ